MSKPEYKVAKVGIMSLEKFKKRTIAIAKGEYTPSKDEPKIWFRSLKSLANALSEENQDLLKLIVRTQPKSVKELENITGRSANNLLRTLRMLEMYGFVKLKKGKSGAGRTPLVPEVIYNGFEIDVNFNEDSSSEENKMHQNINSSHCIPELVKRVGSGVIHIEYFVDEKRAGSASGFISKGYLITNNHVLEDAPQQSEVKLSYQGSFSPVDRKEIFTSSISKFKNFLVAGSDKRNSDFAIFNIPSLRKEKLHDFTLEWPANVEVGNEAVVLGYPLEHRNLVCHKAMVSSMYVEGLVDVLMLDASVNQSNSGGPLVNMVTGNVIGIVTRKATGLTKMFDELLGVIDENIKVGESMRGGLRINDIDPRDLLLVGQNQMKVLTKEILRSANVGIGYAYSVEPVLDEQRRIMSRDDS